AIGEPQAKSVVRVVGRRSRACDPELGRSLAISRFFGQGRPAEQQRDSYSRHGAAQHLLRHYQENSRGGPSKNDLTAELQLPGWTLYASHKTERTTGQVGVGRGENRRVEGVESFQTKLELESFCAQRKTPEQRKVETADPVGSQAIPPEVAESK